MDQGTFEQLISMTAWRPHTLSEVRAELERQAGFHPTPVRDGLDELADVVFAALAGRLDIDRAEGTLSRLCLHFPHQPLCHFYQSAARWQMGNLEKALASLEHHVRLDPKDPIVEMLRLHFQGQPIPGITEEIRLANIRKFAATPLLKNPYLLAVGAIFETIRDRERARVMDVGVGSGAQMVELLGLIKNRPNNLKRLELIGLDFVEGFLKTAAHSIATKAQELAGQTSVSFRSLRGYIERLEGPVFQEVMAEGDLDAVNATITLHEIPGEQKTAALRNLRQLNPRRVVIVEWNYMMENVLPESSLEFLFNVRKAAAEWVAAMREHYAFEEARATIRDILGQAGGQVTSPAARRQECYLPVTCWRALAHACGFDVVTPDASLLQYADQPGMAEIIDGWYLAAYRQAGAVPIAMIQLVPR